MRTSAYPRLVRCLAIALSIVSGSLIAQTSQLLWNTPTAVLPGGTASSTGHGSERAPITVLVFSDFESFPCARSASVLAGLLGQSKNVRLIFKHAPAVTNQNALLSHEAALSAGTQANFWVMPHHLLQTPTSLI